MTNSRCNRYTGVSSQTDLTLVEGHVNDEFEQAPEYTVKFLPTIEYFQRLYGASFDGNDKKAVLTFRNYEAREKLRRLQGELQAVKNGKVPPETCDRIIGKRRKSQHQTYEHWAGLMLLWITSKTN